MQKLILVWNALRYYKQHFSQLHNLVLIEERRTILAKPRLTVDDLARIDRLNEQIKPINNHSEEDQRAMDIIHRAAKALEKEK